SAPAVLRVLRPAVPAEESHEGATDAGEWSGTHLAPRGARNVLQAGPGPGIRRVGAHQDRPPDFVALPVRTRWLVVHGRKLSPCRSRERRSNRRSDWHTDARETSSLRGVNS